MTTINLEDVKNDVASLLQRLKNGEVFLIASEGKPLGRLEPVQESAMIQAPIKVGGERVFGTLVGQIHIPDDFDEMMRDEIEEMFYGKL